MNKTEKIFAKRGMVLSVEKNTLDGSYEVSIRMIAGKKCILHWSLLRHARSAWQTPPQTLWPEGSRAFEQSAVETPFTEQDGYSEVIIRLDLPIDFSLLEFVLFFPDEGIWDNNNNRNYSIKLDSGGDQTAAVGALVDEVLQEIAEEIIRMETGRNSWTLMHRFNLCHDLLDKIRGSRVEGFALIFVWLRFSAIRQLDWQRNYNTQPRDLAHSLDRLTLKLADCYLRASEERELVRLIMTTLGRGGEGQRVRDEVLHIMHRHHIKEVSGHFMEEWHQKLHNNTTPDDIVICDAYLEFLRSYGNLDLFYKKLEQGGVNKQRLENYERPIRSHPDFVPHLRDALIHDFEQFLGILKSVHSGTDLGTAIYAARPLFDAEMHGLMDFVWFHREDRNMPVCSLAEKITHGRRWLSGQLHGHLGRVRDLLFLDLALEDFLRVVVERNLGPHLSGDELVGLTGMMVENLCLSNPDGELMQYLNLWERLGKMPRFEREWSLRAKAVAELLTHALGEYIDRYYRLLQPLAEYLGREFRAEQWTINLFSEEVLRGRPAFIMSMLLHLIDPLLRKSADLGSWQVISSGSAVGKVELAPSLKLIQSESFTTPVVLIIDSVTGEEEIPSGVAAIITPASIDILSHLAVRSRNSGTLFGICYDPDIWERLKALAGHTLRLSVISGDIAFEESEDMGIMPPYACTPIKPGKMFIPGFTSFAVSKDEFNEKNVGGKSNNLRLLTGKLPGWIHLPASVALPFGVFEKALADEKNTDTSEKYRELISRAGMDTGKTEEVLGQIRRTVLELEAPSELLSSLRKIMEMAGLQWPENRDDAWMCIKKVWASKWNLRAYLSRRTNGIPHEDLFMAVLIQKVIEADYSFVIHTVNPLTDNADELYAEAVLGLGEALVGNYPGKALSFTCRKGEAGPRILSFPGKRMGLFGGGLIFRSDSNGEDLTNFAGAGLYDSFLLPKPVKANPDYTADALLWDERFLREFMITIATIGTEVEKDMGYPQDIEGVYSKGKYYVVQTRPQVGIKNANTDR
jgi:alpha-glucan,water dikinase